MRLRVHTQSGSVYRFIVPDPGEGGYITVNFERALPNPARALDRMDDTWYPCEVIPWPPELGSVMLITRPSIPWGEGQLTRTTPVRMVEPERQPDPLPITSPGPNR